MALAPLKDEEPEAQEGSVACGSPTAGLPSVRCLWAEDGGVRGRCHSMGTSGWPPGFPGQGFPKRQDQGIRRAHALLGKWPLPPFTKLLLIPTARSPSPG